MELGGPASQASSPVDSGPWGREDVPSVGRNVVVASAVGESGPGAGWE